MRTCIKDPEIHVNNNISSGSFLLSVESDMSIVCSGTNRLILESTTENIFRTWSIATEYLRVKKCSLVALWLRR